MAGSINIRLTGDNKQLTKTLTTSQAALARFGGAASGLASQLLMIGGPAGAIAATAAAVGGAIKKFAEFETSLTKMRTLVGLSAKEVDGYKMSIYDLSEQTGKSAVELSEALYYITSSGLSGTKAMDALTASAKASAIGMGETQVVADALTSIMNAYGHEAYTAERATNILLSSVKLGKIEADALAGSIGNVIPTASQMGVSFEEVGAALATMSLSGISADEAVTSLNRILLSFQQPSEQARKQMAALGMNAKDLREEIDKNGLLSVLVKMEKALDGDAEATGRIFDETRAYKGYVAVTGAQVETYTKILDDNKRALFDLAKAQKIQGETIQTQYDKMWASIGNFWIENGESAWSDLQLMVYETGNAFKYLGDAINSIKPDVLDDTEEKLKKLEDRLQFKDYTGQNQDAFSDAFKIGSGYVDPAAKPTQEKTPEKVETLTEKIQRLNTELEAQSQAGKINNDTLLQYVAALNQAEAAEKRLAEALMMVNIEAPKLAPAMMAVEDLELISENEIDKLDTADDTMKALAKTLKTEVAEAYKEAQNSASMFGSVASDVAGLVVDNARNQSTKVEAEYQKEIDAVDRKYDAQISNARASREYTVQLEQARSQEIDAINSYHDGKRRAANKKYYEAQKNAAIMQINMDTAMAIMRVWATGTNKWENIAWTAVIGGIGAAQLAMAASQPVPQFQSGLTMPFKGGAARVHNNETIVLPSGSKVETAHQTKAKAMGYSIEHRIRNSDMIFTIRSGNKRYSKITGLA